MNSNATIFLLMTVAYSFTYLKYGKLLKLVAEFDKFSRNLGTL